MPNMDEPSLRVLIITQGLSSIVEPLFNSKHTIVGVIESAARNQKKHGLSSLIRKLVFGLSGYIFNSPSLKKYCSKKLINYRFMFSSNDQHLEDFVRTSNPDVIVVYSMSQLLKSNIYNLPRLGTINLHPSYLPDYRGPNPDFWQYYDCELSPGVTIHFIDDGEDTGDIIYQDRINIPLGTKSPERSQKLVRELGITLLIKSLDALLSNTAPRISQPKNSPTVRARNLKPSEHENLIKWDDWPVDRIWHTLRGTEQWLNAIEQPRGIHYGQRWIVDNFELMATPNRTPGKIYKENGKTFLACRDGIINLSSSFNTKMLIRKIILPML
ncbi:hypothetical protein YA0851_19430 [Pseudomonas synxantha]|uniref:methionyl-tRNA formyltransferase n=1 Tax=Pseudomonas synxantha TaxID=47883 RepID=UPI0018E5D0BE|nr:formyltransferase family protein [Pseudomonas synxantha]MBI6582516.1 hypothetical protein [Pseudomonas synxantha]